MEFDLDSGWKLSPLDGNTGQAYMGVRAEEKVFLKRNTSPFLAALSVEGITPRLVWTKRIGNGDVLTAQEWLNGRTLTDEEMSSASVIKLLQRVHTSQTLKKMLQRVGGCRVTPESLLVDFKIELAAELRNHPLVAEALTFLKNHLSDVATVSTTVCHGDIFKKNWLLSDENRLYLVDWDMAILADPALDLSMLVYQYIAEDKWHTVLEDYQPGDDTLYQRVKWYGVINYLLKIKKAHHENRFHEMNQAILTLQKVMETE